MKALLLAVLCCVPAAAEEMLELPKTPGPSIAVGANYKGGQLDLDFGRGRRVELRALTGRQSSDEGTVSATVVGLRAIQRFRMSGVYHPYLGVEAAYVSARASGTSYRVHGAAPGLFLGVERTIWGRLSAGADVGPYIFLLREESTHTGSTSFDAVANAYVLFRVY